MSEEYIDNSMTGLEIAVIGMAGRFPEANNIEEYWQNLKNGKESISFFSDEELVEYGLNLENIQNSNYIKAKGVLENIENFDNEFFGYSPAEAHLMDPQLRILHECSWEALEDSGYDPDEYRGLIGVYIGGDLNLNWIKKFLIEKNSYAEQTQIATLNMTSSLSTRISYKLNLTGPSYTVNTACSSSLVTIHLACQALLNSECDMALAGGIKVSLPKRSGYIYQKGMVASSDGHCRAFDEKADGMVPGDGSGIVVLKRLEDAINDRDHIYSIIKGSAINNDGARKVGYTAPSIDGQIEAIRMAQQIAEVDSESISYIEAHGTGTELGDPIEIEGLKVAFDTDKKQYCRIGSVKTNIGHLDTAAGVAGFIKTVLSLKNKLLVPSLNYEKPNSKIDFENSPFVVNTELTKWKRKQYPLRAGVSSFGIGGTNAHIVLQENLEYRDDTTREHNIITLSAQNQAALERITYNLLGFLKKNKNKNISDIAYTLQVGRRDFSHRRSLVASSIDEVIEKLSYLNKKDVTTNCVKDEERQIAFMFPGQGSQYVNMGLELYENNISFRKEMDRCFDIVKPIIGYDLRDIVFPEKSLIQEAKKRIDEITVVQPLLFILEYSLAKTLISWGVKPKAMIGYSLGEYVAACISGVFSLEDALRIITVRGKLLNEVPKGSMISVPLSEDKVKPFLNDELSISISNGESCVISGDREAVSVFENKLKEKKYICMRLDNLHIGHSRAVECILDSFSREFENVKLNKPTFRYISSMTGNWIKEGEVTESAYWVKHLRETVRFSLGIETLINESNYTFVEIGPGRDLSILISRYIDKGHIISTIEPKNDKKNDEYYLLKQIGRLWSMGFEIDWNSFNHGVEVKRTSLPPYSFEKNIFDISVLMDFQYNRRAEKVQKDYVKYDKPFSEDILCKVDNKDEKIKTPSNSIETVIVDVFKEMFRIDNIGVDEDFFDLGGDSLKATILVGKIHEKLNVEVPIHEVFNNPTVEKIAQHIISTEEKIYSPIERVETKEYYSLSSQQNRVFIVNNIEDNGVSYNIPMAIKIKGNIEKQKVEEAFYKLAQRHDSLRTCFKTVDGQVVQQIMSKIDFNIEYVETAENEVYKVINEFVRPFDLTKGPLFRVGIFKLSDKEHILIIDIHHIVSDGTSMVIIMNEFFSLYEGRELPECQLQYKDYVSWQRTLKNSMELKKQEDYWLNVYSGEIPVLNLPTDYSRPTTKSFEGKNYNFKISKELTLKLYALANNYNATLYMILVSIYNILLNKYTNQEDIIIGSPFACRTHYDLQNIVGMFVNTLALRNYPQSNKTFEEFLVEVRENTLEVYENQNYQFEELVDKLNIRRDMSRNPLFDTMLVLENMDLGNRETTSMELSLYGIENHTSKFDITLNAFDGANGLEFTFEYCTKLFKTETIERFKNCFLKIIKEIIENPKVKIGDIDILTKEEKYNLIYKFNDINKDYPKDKTIHALFEEQVEKMPDSIALVLQDKKLTYKELNEKANSLATVLRSKGVQADSIVGIMVETSLEMIVGIMGVLKAGGAYLPIDPNYPKERIEYMLSDSESKILLSREELVKYIDFHEEIIDLSDESLFSVELGNLEKINNSKDLAYVIYTSGTTGKPKGVMVEHSSVINLLNHMKTTYPLEDNYVGLLKTNYVFDVSVTEIFGWFMSNGTLVIMQEDNQKDIGSIINSIEKYKVTHINFVPSMLNIFNEIAGDQSNKVKSLKYVFAAGEELKPKLVYDFYNKFDKIKLENLYGPTETTIYSSMYSVNKEIKGKSIPIGKPVNNTKLYILNNNKIMPIGVPGELCIAGDGLARGYLNKPELTAEKFVDNPFEVGTKMYKTGDLAKWLPDGNIEFLGRIDNQVKIRGFRIELGEIENVLLQHESIKEAAVVVWDNKEKEIYICAYVVSEKILDKINLKIYLKELLPEYMVPAYFIQLEKLPVNVNGKIDRRALPQPNLDIGLNKYEAPNSKVEEALVKIWSEVLGVNKVGINNNFFDLGGDSLKATFIVSKIRKDFNKAIPLKELFKRQTIKELSIFIESLEKNLLSNDSKSEKKEY